MNKFEPDYAATLRTGRAYVRLIEAASVLIEWEEDERSRRRLALMRRRCQEGARRLVEVLPPHVTAHRVAASEKSLGTVGEVGKNYLPPINPELR